MKTLQTITKGLLPLLVLLVTASSAWAQFFASYEPAQPCATDTVTFYYQRQGGPVTGTANIEWYIYLGPSAGNVALYGDTVEYRFDTTGTFDVYYTVWDTGTGLVDSGFISIFIDSICADNQISGLVYNDANGNGVQDGGETGIQNKEIIMQPGNYRTLTDANGEYELLVRPGTYTLDVEVPLYYNKTAPASPGTHTVTFATSGGSSTGNDFGLNVAENVQDLRVALNGWFVRPGFSTTYWLDYQNVGTTTEDVTITFTHDGRLTYDQSTPAEDSYSPNTATFTVLGLEPGQGGTYFIEMTGATPPGLEIGDTVVSYASIDPIAGDTIPDNNLDTLTQIVVGSFDPNDKAVYPQGEGQTGRILPVKTLRYHIRFQNTGTFMAEDVRVEDTLDTNLDIVSVNTLETSHSYQVSADPATGAIVWLFNDIMLPDSNSNEPLSHGFITFEVEVIDWENVPNGTVINNTAFIYFDFNEAVITNTTVTTFDRTVGIMTPKALENSRLFPNPVHGNATIEFNNEGRMYQVRVTDISGREVLLTPQTDNNRTELNVSNLNSGMYLYEIITEGATVSKGKFMIH